MMATTATLASPSDSRSAGASTWTVADLLAGVGMGDAAAWGELVRRYQGLLVRRAHRYHLQEADLLDAVQTTWQRLVEHWDAIEQPERLGGWLATTVGRECLRIVNGRRACVPEADVAVAIVDPRPDPEQHAVDADLATAVRELVDALPERRQAMVRADFLGFHIRRMRKRGTNKHYVYTTPSRASVQKARNRVRERTYRSTLNRDLDELITSVNRFLRGWANYFRHGVSKATFNAIDHHAWWRLAGWIRRKHHLTSRSQLRRRFCGAGWRIAHNGVVFTGASSVTVTRYRYRGANILTPWTPTATSG